MATNYKITDKDFKALWLVVSNDAFVCIDNLRIIEDICHKNAIDEDSISYFSMQKPNWQEIFDMSNTPSFFGARLIVLKDADITALSEEDLSQLSLLMETLQGNHLACIFTCEDDKNLKGKKYTALFDLAKKLGTCHIVGAIDEKYLEEMIVGRAKKQGTVLDKDTAKKIVENIGKDVGLLINEVDKYCALCDYSQISKEDVEHIGIKTVEASVFDMIDLICKKKSAAAIEKLNDLFDKRTDEMAILGALISGFVDIHRCKLASSKGISFSAVHQDFEKTSKPYRYQKAMSNSNNFTQEGLNEIIALLLQTDISSKSSSVDKKQLIYLLLAQIIAKGMA
ncbi:MAG: DNA polymerase III subunit delta [Oscillospiraceae bacterium]